MANAPDLSLRGRFAPMAISPARSGQCRGADSRARRRTCNLYKPPSKWQTLPTCHCEERSDVAISPTPIGQCRGADSRARRRTCNLYKPPSKWQTPPTCHCEERSDVAISQYYVGYHESSGENVTAFPRLHPKGTSSRFALRAPRPLRGLAMTIQASAVVHQRPSAVEYSLTRRSLPARGTPHP